jgi:hypothetical protein
MNKYEYIHIFYSSSIQQFRNNRETMTSPNLVQLHKRDQSISKPLLIKENIMQTNSGYRFTATFELNDRAALEQYALQMKICTVH